MKKLNIAKLDHAKNMPSTTANDLKNIINTIENKIAKIKNRKSFNAVDRHEYIDILKNLDFTLEQTNFENAGLHANTNHYMHADTYKYDGDEKELVMMIIQEMANINEQAKEDNKQNIQLRKISSRIKRNRKK